MSARPAPAPPTAALLRVCDLRIGVRRRGRKPLVVVDTADVSIVPGEMLGIVGESGSGKTMLCRSLIGTLERRGAYVLDGSIRLSERELAGASEATWRRIRGREVGYIPQSALAGLNPVLTIETQLLESLRGGDGHSRNEARGGAKRLLDVVHIGRPELVLDQYPHELSGGMRQRVMIAAALAQRPGLLVADEPTTGLDVTVQHEIMELLREIRSELGTAVILVSHDLALIEDVCDRVTVMHAGATVESGTTSEVLHRPNHPYTVALQRSRIDLAEAGEILVVIAGEPPSVGEWPPGCRFARRCPLAMADCSVGDHPRLVVRTEHLSACIHADRMGELR